ncbi:methylated-DNA--[protein]-cysteine S-methyltransferase [Arcanobacterium ihumii]|uniref:methylated-DNA--[protein]-cysteine S-methyltransferase n=1 Tax=Arcanobacterium ihumii TaxID=2138162 RepID=UPI001F31596B|nr:methylated-DNA--[protein]-cysteine S-methyltransferase [Arcanobacterium ihumii]
MNTIRTSAVPISEEFSTAIRLSTGRSFLDEHYFAYSLDDAGSLSRGWIMHELLWSDFLERHGVGSSGSNKRLVGSLADAHTAVREAIGAWCQQDPDAFQNLKITFTGTEFLKAARKAMCKVPFGEMVTYGELAAEIGHPRASRAIGTACATNPVALIVPCHRIIPQSTRTQILRKGKGSSKVIDVGNYGIDVGNYAIGSKLKYELLSFEGAI